MIIPGIITFNFTPNNLKSEPKNSYKTNPWQNDSFQLQCKSQPSFGRIIPKKGIFKCINKFIKEIDKISDIEELKKLSIDFYTEKLRLAVYKNAKQYQFKEGSSKFILKKLNLGNNLSEKDKLIQSGYINNLVNMYAEQSKICYSSQNDLNSMKKQLKENMRTIKVYTKKWVNFEKWSNNLSQKAQSEPIFNLLNELNHHISIESSNFIAEVLESIKAYSKSNPIIKIEEVYKDNSFSYYADFRIKNNRSVGDDELKIIFLRLMKALKNNGYNDNIEDVVQKGGAYIRIPIYRPKQSSGCF